MTTPDLSEFYTRVKAQVASYNQYLCNPDHKLEVADAYLSRQIRDIVVEFDIRVRREAETIRTADLSTPDCTV